MSKIVSIATAVPAHQHLQADIANFADAIHSSNAADSRKLRFLYRHSGISTRYSTVPDYSLPAKDRQFYSKAEDLEPFPNLEQRMISYATHAAPLAVEAIETCIENKIKAAAITHLITVSCTGMSAPGLDLDIMEAMQLPSDLYRTSINFMGCYAAIHGLKQADAICKSEPNANVIVVCVELCTLHFQKAPTIDNITSTLLFADGAAAVLVQHDSNEFRGMLLKSFYSTVAFKGKRDMSWQLSSTGFLMTLSGYVPDLLKEDFEQLIAKATDHAGISKESVDYWCIHPGGKKILESIQQSVQLERTDLRHSYAVLNDYGNMSSPTILFVLKKIWEELEMTRRESPANVLGAAFGPGLTMETFTAVYA